MIWTLIFLLDINIDNFYKENELLLFKNFPFGVDHK